MSVAPYLMKTIYRATLNAIMTINIINHIDVGTKGESK